MPTWITPSAVGSIVLAIVGAVAVVWRMRVARQIEAEALDQKAKMAKEQAEQRTEAMAEQAKITEAQEKRIADEKERAARHEREAEERKAERDQYAEMVAMLRKQGEETLAVLRNELDQQHASSAHNFEVLERNTKNTEVLAQAVSLQTAQLASMQNELSTLRGTVQVAVAIRQAQGVPQAS